MAAPVPEDALLRYILEGTASEAGQDFFASLVRCTAQALGIAGVWVTEFIPSRRELRALSFWFEDHYIHDYQYSLTGTPCENVIEQACLIHYADRIIELFPGDPDLPGLNAVSYLGFPLLDVDGSVLGHLGALHTRPLQLTPTVEAVFRIFAARAAAELRRCRAEAAIRDSEQRFSSFVNSAMDAIFELGEDFRILRANGAAEQLFGSGLEGRSFLSLVDSEGAQRLKQSESVWVSRGLKVIRADGTRIAAEASITRFVVKGEPHLGIILRSIQELLDAERRIVELESDQQYGTAIIGKSPAFRKVLSAVKQVAPTLASVLITGETGTGKELIARAVHEASRRAGKTLVKVNCAAIPAALMESEFFGHEKGAFTGANQRRIGRFELANGGTIFLDEVGELALELQPKLLRVLQEGEFESVGSSQTRKIDVRVVAATNRDLLDEVKQGRFREDLYYRLHVFPIAIPPLRERGDDVELLARAFIDNYCRKIGRPVVKLSPDGLRRLSCYHWPGNVRELQNVMERAVILAHDGIAALDQVLTADMLSRPQVRSKRDLVAMEKATLIEALERATWKVAGDTGAAKLLGVPPSTLNSRMKALGIKRPR